VSIEFRSQMDVHLAGVHDDGHYALELRVSAPLFVLRELGGHGVRYSFNPLLAGASDPEPVFYVPGDNRPISAGGQSTTDAYRSRCLVEGTHRRAAINAWSEYTWLRDHGILAEVARNVLPTSLFQEVQLVWNLSDVLHLHRLCFSPTHHGVQPAALAEVAVVVSRAYRLASEEFPFTVSEFERLVP
jgi:thymidylate synthase (FAD)